MPQVVSINQALYDRLLAHNIVTQRYSAAVISRILKRLEVANRQFRLELLEAIESGSGVSRIDYLERLINQVESVRLAMLDSIESAINGELRTFADVAAEFQNTNLALISNTVNAAGGVQLRQLNSAQLYAVSYRQPWNGKLLKEGFDALKAQDLQITKEALRAGWIAGRGSAEITRELFGRISYKNDYGLLGKTRSNYQSLIRTSMQHFANQAARETSKNSLDLISRWQHLSKLDSKTSETCIALANHIYTDFDKVRWPPLHYRCRSTILSLVANYPAPATPDPDEWLAGLSGDTQDKLLGKAVAQGFRDGKITRDDLIKRVTLEPITLAELKAINKL
jgi:SPP1 gp7 family putative phage head morphogenesis protein